MAASLSKHPVDIYLCFLWNLILLFFVFFGIDQPIRVFFALPFTFFIPGYILIFVLFPYREKDGKGISNIERFIFSIGFSIAVVALIGLVMNFTPWGIRVEPVLIILSFFVFSIGAVALFRWYRKRDEERFKGIPSLLFHRIRNKINKPSDIFFIVLIIIPVILIIYTISIPIAGEKFTQFYVLGPDGSMNSYPSNLSVGENASVLLGIVNHEYQTMDYRIGVWLVNQSIFYNETESRNITIIHHMWFLDEVSVRLNHSSINPTEPTGPQWLYNYTFTISRQGHFKLLFLLFTTDLGDFIQNEDYMVEADFLLQNMYRDVHIWVTIT